MMSLERLIEKVEEQARESGYKVGRGGFGQAHCPYVDGNAGAKAWNDAWELGHAEWAKAKAEEATTKNV